MFTHLEQGYGTAAGNFSALPVLVQVFNSFVPCCVHLEQELINFCTWWKLRSSSEELQIVVEGFVYTEVEVTTTCLGTAGLPYILLHSPAQTFQECEALLPPCTSCVPVRVSVALFKVGSGMFRWCCHLRAQMHLIETSWNFPSMKPAWSVSQLRSWDLGNTVPISSPKGRLPLFFFPPSLPKPLCPLNSQSCYFCLCSLPWGLSGPLLGAVNLRSVVLVVAVC